MLNSALSLGTTERNRRHAPFLSKNEVSLDLEDGLSLGDLICTHSLMAICVLVIG